MKIKDKKVEKQILRVSKKLFLKSNFRSTSMRDIANTANISVANIYTYFKNKDEILEAITNPIIQKIEDSIEKFEANELIESNRKIHEKEYINNLFKDVIDFIVENKDEFSLLILKSDGSKTEFRISETIARLVFLENKSFEMGLIHHTDIVKSKPSQFIIHRIWEIIFSTIKTLLEEDCTKEVMKRRINELFQFLGNGYSSYYIYEE